MPPIRHLRKSQTTGLKASKHLHLHLHRIQKAAVVPSPRYQPQSSTLQLRATPAEARKTQKIPAQTTRIPAPIHEKQGSLVNKTYTEVRKKSYILAWTSTVLNNTSAGLASTPEKPMPSGPQKTAAAVTSTMERRPVTFSEDKKYKSNDVFQTGQGTGGEDNSFSVKKGIRSESGSGNAKPTNLAQQAKRAGYLPAKPQTPYNTWPRATTAKQTTPEEELKVADEHLARVRDGRGCTDCTKKRCHWKE